MSDFNPFNVPEFRAELGQLLDEKLGPIVELVNAHEAALNRAKGARWAFAILWSGLVAVLELLFHWRRSQ